ncbi:MAG: RNA polymerase sigma factor [Bacteroidia bacterium]|nr:RNA polymerase sigma factor [Bacteroidia bacterium]
MYILHALHILNSEADIIKACISGKRSAQEWVYNEYKGQLMGICRRYCSSYEQAQDVLQDSFIKIFENIKHFNNSGSFIGWMCRIVINTAITHNLKWDNRRSTFDGVEYDVVENINLLHNLSLKELLALVEKLPDGCRIVFNMYVIDDFTHAEIAEQLKISVGTSKSQLSRAKSLLMAQLKLIEEQELKRMGKIK